MEAILHLGSNIEPKQAHLDSAIRAMQSDFILLKKSSYYQTQAWGNVTDTPFINIAAVIKTELQPLELLAWCQKTELRIGRTRTKKWSDRIIDIDIIFMEQTLLETPKLTIPHPFMQDRNFVLAPLNEIVPNFLHPKFHKTIADLAVMSKDTCFFERI